MKIFDPKLTGSIEIQNTITGNVTIAGGLTVEGSLGGGITGSATASYVEYSNIANKPTLLSGSYQIASDISGSFTTLSSSLASELLKNTTDTLTGDLTVTGTLTAQDLHVQQVTSSIVYSSGSNTFGENVSDTQTFTGSLQVSGSTNYFLGDVAIGTTNPLQKFVVATATNGKGVEISPGTLSYIQAYDRGTSAYSDLKIDALNIRFGTNNGTERIRINSGGSVGIGTDSPAYMLDVNEKIRMVGGMAITPTTSTLYNIDGTLSYYGTTNAVYLNGAGANGWLRLQGSGVENNRNAINIFSSAASPADTIDFRTGNSDSMRITSAGSVGIGTTSPRALLDINVASGSQATTLASSVTYAGLYLNADAANGSNNIRIGESGAGSYYMQVSNSAGTTPYAINLNPFGGSVGIGTTSPQSGLELSGANNTAAKLTLTNTAPATDNSWSLNPEYNSQNLTLNEDSTPRVTFKEGGYVGIGRTSPVSILELGDDTPTLTISDTGNNYNDGDVQSVVHLSGRWYSGTANPASDNYSDARIVLRKNSGDGTGGSSLAFETSANGAGGLTEAIRIDKSQNVGIGVISPQNKVDIYSNENVPLRVHRPSNANLDSSGAWGIGFSTRGDAVTSTDDVRAGIFSYYNGNLFFATNTTDIEPDPDASARMTISNNGKVGIGTISPAEKLTIDGTVSGAYVRISNAASGDISSGFMIYNGSNLDTQIYTNPTFGNTTFLTREALAIRTGGSQRMYITSGGLVGIGTTSPAAAFHIHGSGDAIRVTSTNTGVGGAQMDLLHYTTSPDNEDVHGVINFGGYYSGTSSAYGSAIKSIWTGAGSRLGRLEFYTRNGADFNSVMTINHASNVGIGTTGPTTKLHINGSSAHLQFTGGNNRITYSGHRALEGSHDGATLQVGEGYTKTLMYGKVGIATTSPQGGIHVKGNPIVVDDGYQNHQTMIYTSGQAGTYNGSFTFETPDTGNGANSVGYGGYVCEIYISGYDGKYCHAIFSGYINNGISAGEATILRSSSGWSISQSQKSGTYQGISFVVDYPSGLVHPCARIFFTKGGDNANAGYDLTNVTTTWS